MADLGFNTCTFYGDAETTKRHMAAASEVGLLSMGVIHEIREDVPE